MEVKRYIKSLMLFNKKVLLFLIITFFFFSFKNKTIFFSVPSDFPKLVVPKENPITSEKIRLGKMLFFDKMLSRDSSISCASCHNPKYAFTDQLKKAKGVKDRMVSRNTPTLTNIAYNHSFLRDGVNPSLEAQVIVPIHEKNEFDFHILLVAERMKKNKKYVELSKKAFGEEPNPKVISNAIASYERTLISSNSRFDQYNFHGDSLALNASEIRGMKLFYNNLNCSSCHSGFNFSNGEIVNTGLYENYNDVGKMRVTLDQSDNGKFKVPTLRNISITYPYMHDGNIKTLEEVIDHYIKGGEKNPNKDERIKPFNLSKLQKQDLIAFLKCLTDSSFIAR